MFVKRLREDCFLGRPRFWSGQNLVELADDVPLETADDLFLDSVPHENRIGTLTCRFAGWSMRPRIR
jgi:hypothetical protein